jgi:hypothetical protein
MAVPLDAIHMATAMEWARMLLEEEMVLYTYDKNLNALASLRVKPWKETVIE